MPPRTRTNKTTKSLKENINVGEKTKVKVTGKVSKPTRKALSDKTNSASDDNTSVEVLKVCPKKHLLKTKIVEIAVENVIKERPRRDRRLPGRFDENELLKKLSLNNSINKSPSKLDKASTPPMCTTESPFKTAQKSADISIMAPRPKRVCRLPSRLEDHSISPNRLIPVQPVQASTPKVQNKLKTVQHTDTVAKKVSNNQKSITLSNKKESNHSETCNEVNKQKNNVNEIADTNNNAKKGRPVRNKKKLPNGKKDVPKVTHTSPKKSVNSPINKNTTKQILKEFSFRILEDKKQKEIKGNGLDVYEFTYDPTEEPPPQKKKTKKAAKRKPAPSKPKQILYKNNYDKNLAKALSALRKVVSKKPTQCQPKLVDNTQNTLQAQDKIAPIPAPPALQVTNTTEITNKSEQNILAPSVPAVQNSIRIEDIAADFEPSIQHELNYSPINSPHPNETPSHSNDHPIEGRVALIHQDPLNLKENLSFFDDVPVASSSMNVSNRHPHASPWRVEFNNLPIKWHVNSYMKPNMTPAMECSFVNFDENKKKHVYTNMVPAASDSLPEIVENERPNFVQTSIISLFREVAEKNANKKRGRSATPKRAVSAAKENEAFNTIEINKTPRKVATPRKAGENSAQTPDKTSSNYNKENATPNEKCRENLKRKLDEDLYTATDKTQCKSNEKNNTLFGFDDTEDSENFENVSPKKNVRALRPRNRGVLKQINEQVRPARAVIPSTTKSANSEVVNKLFSEMKAASDAPLFPEIDNLPEKEVTNICEDFNELTNEDSNSVHLFEDIEVVHHTKQQRKSYGKVKKVAFNQNSDFDSDSRSDLPPKQVGSDSEEDDLADLTFEMPYIKEKKARKKTKKTKMTKKEAEQAEAWAASFNSMCEDIDDFPLLVE